MVGLSARMTTEIGCAGSLTRGFSARMRGSFHLVMLRKREAHTQNTKTRPDPAIQQRARRPQGGKQCNTTPRRSPTHLPRMLPTVVARTVEHE